MSLSVSIICRNNQASIGRTLESVRGLATEIVAVDSGSTDGTIGLLGSHNARIIRSDWLGYVKTKQLALESCTQDWILCLDSDESLLPELAQSVRETLGRNDPTIGGYRLNRRVFYRDRPIKFAWQPERRLRLVRRGEGRWAGLDPHDRLDVTSGKAVGELRGDLRHDSFPSFSEWLSKAAGHARLSAATNFADGKRCGLVSVFASPVGAVAKMLILKQSFRDGWPGVLAAGCVGAYSIMKHIALAELTRTGGKL
jgi:glycosyltransferase involved in cell wall biosynthesis